MASSAADTIQTLDEMIAGKGKEMEHTIYLSCCDHELGIFGLKCLKRGDVVING